MWGAEVRYIYPNQPYWNATPAKDHLPGIRWVKNPRSHRIHRTDFWSGGRRCFTAETAGDMGTPGKGPFKGKHDHANVPYDLTYPWNYIDVLPISLDAVRQNRDLARGVLCDYCFFGGPTRQQLRTDFPS
jgi:hypothetical protein